MTADADRDQRIFWLADAPDSPLLGGKARSLARLAAAGLSVPPGFVLAADASPPDDPIDTSALPAETAAALAAAYAELSRRVGLADPLVAVRSSALAEDLADASFAGLYATVLGVRGERDVLAAAARCRASLGSPEVAAYRAATERRLGRSLPPPGMAILVQSLVPAEAAGIADTADPLTGDRATVRIGAAWGLGRSVVDGAVESDVWRVDRESLAVVEVRVGEKATRAGIGLDAKSEPVPAERRRRPCLTFEQAAEIAALALRAEAVVGGPADVEWALADGRVWLLQARPLTALPAGAEATDGRPTLTPDPSPCQGEGGQSVGSADSPTLTPDPSPCQGEGSQSVESAAESADSDSPLFPFAWPDAEAPTLHWYQRAEDRRAFEAIPPFEQDARTAFFRAFAEAQWVAGSRGRLRAEVFNGYMYYAEASALDEAERARRERTFRRDVRCHHARGDSHYVAVLLPLTIAGNDRLAAVAPDSLDNAGLAAHVADAGAWYEESCLLHFISEPWDDESPIGRYGRLYRELTGDADPEAIWKPFGHLPHKDTELVAGLIGLARLAQGSPALGALFAEESADVLLARLDATPDGPAFRAALDAFLAEFGLHCGASQGVLTTQILPGWAERPDLVVETVRRYLPQDLDALEAAGRRSAETYERDVAALRAKVAATSPPADKLAEFEYWFDAARRMISGALDHNYYLDSPGAALLHRALLAAGWRLASAGALEAAEDTWYLHARELPAALRSLDGPSRPDWRALVAGRQAVHDWQRSLTPPEWLGAPPPPPKPKRERPAPAEDGEPPASLIVRGRGVSRGVATGRVRHVGTHDLVPAVQPGDVFVAADCGALWATVLPVVAAVVIEDGDDSAHAMRVCREFGVPAVIQAKGATALLRAGLRVTVDGDKGWVLGE